MENQEEYIKSLKKPELLKYAIRQTNEVIQITKSIVIRNEKIKELGNTIIEIQTQLTDRKTDFDKKLGIHKNCKVFIEALSTKGVIRTYTGFVTKETKKHIKISIKTKDGNYSYAIHKDLIQGMKLYRFNQQDYDQHYRDERLGK